MRSFFKEYLPDPKRGLVDQNFFSFIFMNEMSHDYLERLFWVDNDMLKFLGELLTPSFIENTLVVLMGKQNNFLKYFSFKQNQFKSYLFV